MRMLDLDHRARHRHGLVTLADSGLSRDAWYRAVRSGSIEQLHPGVARLSGTPHTSHQRIAAAVLAASHPLDVNRTGLAALASHRSAAWLWLDAEALTHDDDEPADVDLTMLDRRRTPRLRNVQIHRPTDTKRLLPHRIAGVGCTNILRTLLDLGAVDERAVHPLLGHALSVKAVDLSAVESAVTDHSEHGRSGVAALRAAVDDWAIDAKPADSVLELAFSNMVRRQHLPAVEFHPKIEGWEVDFRFVGTRLIVECDGWMSHGLDRGQFERDRHRDADLTAAGWVVSRHTYRAITRHGAQTAHRLRLLLASLD